MPPNELAIAREHAAEILRPWPVHRRVEDDAPDVATTLRTPFSSTPCACTKQEWSGQAPRRSLPTVLIGAFSTSSNASWKR